LLPFCTCGSIWMADEPVPRIATFLPDKSIDSRMQVSQGV
jgi:hypothetical protein